MASSKSIVDYIVDQASAAGNVRARAMFGEYTVYCDEKVVALICDDQLFVKPTDDGRALAGNVEEASPYPGAKPCLLIPEAQWDDADGIAQLFRVTATQLPVPKKRPKKKSKN